MTGNALAGLTNQALTPAQAFDTPFSPPAVSSGNQLDLAWTEAGDAWDGLRYTSLPGTVQLTGVPCATGSAASYWITGSADITLNEDVAWTNGPLVETDACTPVSPGAPVAGTNIGVAATWQAITEGSGWRVQVRAARDLGLVSSTADYQGGLWGGVTSLRALRSPPANCLAGERLVGGLCVPCVDYQACVGSSLVTQQHCATGPAPVSASASSYQACVGGIVQTQQECLNPGDIASADAPCTLANCATDERVVNGSCEACPEYQICSAGSLVTDKYCGVGAAPGNAREVMFDSCVGGVTTPVTECVADGDPTPMDSACPPCTPPAPGSVTYELDSSADVNLPDSTDWVAGPSIRTNACGGSPPATSASTSDSRISFGAFVAEAGGGSWPIRVAATLAGGEIYDLFYWYSTGWNPGGSAWYFRAKRDPLTCAAGEREANGVCEVCPTHQVCSNGITVDEQFCGSGNAPADAACVTSCPPNERLVAGVCGSCLTHWECSAGRRVQREYCEAGSPPLDARNETVRACVGGVQQTNTVCVAAGDPRPADTPCTSCPSGQRLVAGSCQTCPTYNVCTASVGDYSEWPQGFLASRTFCDPGNPPTSASMTLNFACVSGDTDLVSHCIGEGGLAYDPGDVPCPGDSCIEYEDCYREDGWTLSQMTGQYRDCDTNPIPPAPPQVIPRPYCQGEGYSWETTITQYFCVGYMGLDSLSDVPAGAACPSDSCDDYWVCSSPYTTNQYVGSLSVEREFCGDTPPVTADNERRDICVGGVDYPNARICIGEGGYDSDPGDQPCVMDCPADQRPVNGFCRDCPTYWGCIGDWRVEMTWCDAGRPPANARYYDVEVCRNGVTREAERCVADGESVPPDDPCPVSCASNERLVNGRCESCPTYEVCSNGRTVDRNHCSAGNPPADRPCATSCSSGERVVNGACEACPTYQVCSNGRTQDRQHCSTGNPPTDRPCVTSCSSGERLVNGSCEACPTYQVCSNGRTVDRQHCGTGNPPTDRPCVTSCSSGERLVNGACEACPTYEVCSNGRTVDRQHCSTGNPPADRPCATSCSSGERLVNGTCEACPTYEVCSNGRTVDRNHCGTGNPPADRPCATSCSSGERLVNGACEACPTYQVCSNGRTQDRQHCSTGNPPTDRPCATSCSSGERLVNGTCEACPTHKVCSNGVTVNQQHCSAGNPPRDDPCPTACPAGQELVNGVCVTCQRTAEPSCAEGETWTWNQSACQWNSSRVDKPACSTGKTWTWNEGTCGWRSRSVTEPSCPSGQQSNWDSNACGYGPCQGCPTGTRLVNGSCVTCPTHKICDGTGLTTSPYCGSGTPPVDAVLVDYEACVNGVDKTLTACVPPGGTAPIDDPCRTCVDYKVCSGNSLATMEYCGDGSPPANAWIARYEACVNGAAVTRSACVAGGGTAPPDETPCCVDYKACSGTLLVTEQYCGTGSAPDDARLATYACCINNVDTTCTMCVAANVIVDPEPCPTCVDYKACSGTSLVTEQYCGSGTPPGNAWLASYLSCPGEVTRTACVAYGGTAPLDETPCCVDYKVCSGSGTSLENRQYCGSGSPPANARLVDYVDCVNDVNVDLTTCVAPGGTDPRDNVCPTCVDYKACSGNLLVTEQYCGSGSAPGDAWLASYQACSGGSEVTRAACVAYGGTAPADETPCCVDYKACNGNSLVTREHCGSGTPPDDARLATYACCINNVDTTCTTCVAANVIVDPKNNPCPTCVDYKACSGNSLVTREYCGDSPPGNASPERLQGLFGRGAEHSNGVYRAGRQRNDRCGDGEEDVIAIATESSKLMMFAERTAILCRRVAFRLAMQMNACRLLRDLSAGRGASVHRPPQRRGTSVECGFVPV